jgi:hypothetical protein
MGSGNNAINIAPNFLEADLTDARFKASFKSKPINSVSAIARRISSPTPNSSPTLAKDRKIRSGGMPELASTAMKLAVNGKFASIFLTFEDIVMTG